jgi:hypothetical protein
VFVHLTADPAAPPLSQDDHFPQNGSTGTESWQTDTVYRDVYSLPLADVPPGEYLLMVGFYDPNTNERPVEPVIAGQLTLE